MRPHRRLQRAVREDHAILGLVRNLDALVGAGEDHGVLAITSIYIGYLLPMLVEIQWWDYKDENMKAAAQ